MNVYDFDNTIYDGESVLDFYLFLLRKDASLLKLMPKVLSVFLRYKMCLITAEELLKIGTEYAGWILTKFPDMEGLASEFWDKNQHKIKKFYLESQKEDDVILSAGCGFLLREICSRIGVKNILASEIDLSTGEITRLCFAHAKPEIFSKSFPLESIENFYTDSLNDKPMFSYAKNSYMVKGEKIRRINL